jgi:menaquinone-specific isochorismate synthase
MNAIASPSRPDDPAAGELRRAVLAAPRASELIPVVVSAPARSAEFLIGLGLSSDASYFAAPGGGESLGLGAARALTASGPERFHVIRLQAEALFRELPEASGARLFGGFAFQTGRAQSDTWRSFGEARFVLPRVAYERAGDTARLRLVLTEREIAEASGGETLELAARVLGALHGSEVPGVAANGSGNARLHEQPAEAWAAQVHAIEGAIARGELEKLVLARRVDLELESRISPAAVLERLRDLAPECARFAFSADESTFLGAAPERLVSKRDSSFETEAVAGSQRVGVEPTSRLLESSKDREEQAIVLRELLVALEPFAASIEHSTLPEVHVLRHVAHLRNRVQGTLNARRHVLELVERLHPTPAVAGVPTERALRWIAAHEPYERGWYAGPVGWFDGAGDGEFVVALRSGVVRAQRLALYAGAGIVRGSEAESELAETRWKLAALLGALGVER